MSIIPQLTQDCPREDCAIQDRGSTSTLLAWSPTYDKNGNRIDKGDPNTRTTKYIRRSCYREWYVSTQYGESKITERKREAAPSAE